MPFTSAVIVAGGMGRRMKADKPKQFLLLKGSPILLHTLKLFNCLKEIHEIILVLPEDDISWFKKEIGKSIDFKPGFKIVPGGIERQDSVRNGLDNLDEKSDIVLVHDGVRPFVKKEEILEVISGCDENDGVILGLPVFETIKRTENNIILETIPRENMFLAQTPQGFKTQILKKAHETALEKKIIVTDDASILENLGYDVKVIEGSRENIKITTPGDLEFAEKLLS